MEEKYGNMKQASKISPTTEQEDLKIREGIRQDSDTWEPSDEEWALARPAKDVLSEMGIEPPRPRGRPKLAHPKEAVSIRLDADIVKALRSSGPGWQTRVNDMLRQWLKLDETEENEA